MGLNLCSLTHDVTLAKIFNMLANSFPLESVDRFSKSASDFSVTNSRTLAQLRDRYQSELRDPRNISAIETPKVTNYSFYPTVSCPLTLVPIKRVLGVPITNAISELGAQPQRVHSR
jgi:hypothetical protein